MEYVIKEISSIDDNDNMRKTAGGKAREDIDSILSVEGTKQIEFIHLTCNTNRKVRGLARPFAILANWKKQLSMLKPGDTLYIQYPLFESTVFQAVFFRKYIKRGIKVILIVHDLIVMREQLVTNAGTISKIKNYFKEISLLKFCNKIIVHNSKMKEYFIKQFKISEKKLIELEIFDYFIPNWDELSKDKKEISKEKPVVISANLIRSKSGYAYQLPKEPSFNLYGINYDDIQKDNVKYFGSFLPDELTCKMEGSFGLVWDGEDFETCSGVYGNYLRINNPHKISLYIASELPVIIWKEAAMAEFIEKNKLGFSVASIEEIADKINSISQSEYDEMIANVKVNAKKLRDGFYTKKALNRASR